MITIVKGNLLEAKENIIGHQVNCQGVMGSGVAKQISDKYPEAYRAYMEFCRIADGLNMLGRCQLVTVDTKKYVANLFGQEFYGYGKKYTDENKLRRAIKILKNMARTNGLSIALPFKIGCDRGGGDWFGVVYPMIHEIFSDYDVTLYKWEG